MSSDPTLFDVAPAGSARRRDPRTSTDAARRQGGGARAAILAAFREHGPMTDEQLADRLAADDWHGPTVKTARSRLMRDGFIVATGRTEKSRRDQPQIVWALHASLRPTVEVHDTQGRVA